MDNQYIVMANNRQWFSTMMLISTRIKGEVSDVHFSKHIGILRMDHLVILIIPSSLMAQRRVTYREFTRLV